MTDALQQQIALLSEQRDLLMTRLQQPQPDVNRDENANDRAVDTEALNLTVQAALTKALGARSSEDNSRFQRTIDDLQSRLASTEVSASPTPGPRILMAVPKCN
jgi:hypothetical protein